MFRTFKAKIGGVIILSNSGESGWVDNTITFTRSRTLLKDKQVGRLFFADKQDPVINNGQYSFSKGYDRKDKMSFVITAYGDKYKRGLMISNWNKIKANIIHHRYFIDREKEWFIKTLIAAAIGFLFGIIGSTIGYRQGYENGLKEGKSQIQDTTLKSQ